MTWLWIGDSILKGLVPFITALWLGGTTDSYMAEATFDANSGWSTRRFLNEGHIVETLDQHNPDVVVVMLGTNDFSGKEQFEKRVIALCQLIIEHDHENQLVWIGSFTSAERNGWAAEAISACAMGEEHVKSPVFVDGMTLSDGLQRSRDGIHFTRQGYSDLTERVMQAVGRALAVDEP